ncbi:MAG: outer membrane beta-barrel protein [Pseudomonadota bacterium]
MRAIFVFLMLFIACSDVFAEQAYYGFASAGYAKTELEDIERDRPTFKIGIGYELNREWSFEAGIQSFGNDDGGDFPTDDATAQYYGVFVSALGRAGNASGELFYRLGLSYVDAEVLDLPTGNVCASGLELVTGGTPVCEFDEGVIAGHLGLGFDYFFTPKFTFRTEVEWTRGQDGFDSTGIYLGILYNF